MLPHKSPAKKPSHEVGIGGERLRKPQRSSGWHPHHVFDEYDQCGSRTDLGDGELSAGITGCQEVKGLTSAKFGQTLNSARSGGEPPALRQIGHQAPNFIPV